MTNKKFNTIINEMLKCGYVYDVLDTLNQKDTRFDIYNNTKDIMDKCWAEVNLLYTSFLMGLLNRGKESVAFVSTTVEGLYTILYNLYYIQKYKQDNYTLVSVEEFNSYIEKRVKSVLSNKAVEYATKDRLHNFNKLEEKLAPLIELHKSPYIKCLDFMCKHLVSIDDIINEENPVPLSKETVEEKFIDALNYCILLKACIIEKIKEV